MSAESGHFHPAPVHPVARDGAPSRPVHRVAVHAGGRPVATDGLAGKGENTTSTK